MSELWLMATIVTMSKPQEVLFDRHLLELPDSLYSFPMGMGDAIVPTERS